MGIAAELVAALEKAVRGQTVPAYLDPDAYYFGSLVYIYLPCQRHCCYVSDV